MSLTCNNCLAIIRRGTHWGGKNASRPFCCGECKFEYEKREGCEVNTEQTEPKEGPPSKYHVRNIWKDQEYIDFYMYYDQLKVGQPHQVGDSSIEHAMKKLSAAGMRSGGKSKVQDLKEAIWSLNNAIEMIEKSGGE